MPTRYTAGDVTIELDDGLDAFVRSLMTAAEAEAVALLEAEAAAVAQAAEASWYEQVDRRTGRSGDLEVVTTVDAGAGEVRVGIRSVDTRLSGGKPVAMLVHRPGALSRVRTEITRAEYGAIRERGDKRSVVHERKTGRYFRYTRNPKASDGRVLIVELVRRPYFGRVRVISARLGELIARRVGG